MAIIRAARSWGSDSSVPEGSSKHCCGINSTSSFIIKNRCNIGASCCNALQHTDSNTFKQQIYGIGQKCPIDPGQSTENGKFHKAAQDHKSGLKQPDIVTVYEKIKKGIWSDNGYFHLVDSWVESDGTRGVFKFKLVAVEGVESDEISVDDQSTESKRSRIIPTSIKLEVWKRDAGKCVECGATDELHFDHILPFSRGGTSLKVDNVQLLCARHNLEKSAKIQ